MLSKPRSSEVSCLLALCLSVKFSRLISVNSIPHFQPDTKGIFLLYHKFLRSCWLQLSLFGWSSFIIILCFLGLGTFVSEYFIYLPHDVSISKYSEGEWDFQTTSFHDPTENICSWTVWRRMGSTLLLSHWSDRAAEKATVTPQFGHSDACAWSGADQVGSSPGCI